MKHKANKVVKQVNKVVRPKSKMVKEIHQLMHMVKATTSSKKMAEFMASCERKGIRFVLERKQA